MAELLIRLADTTNPDPAKDARGCWKRGDVVEVRPDGFRHGRFDGPPFFAVVKVAGLTVEEAQAKYTQIETVLQMRPVDGEMHMAPVRRRAVGIDLDTVRTQMGERPGESPWSTVTKADLTAAEVVKPSAVQVGTGK